MDQKKVLDKLQEVIDGLVELRSMIVLADQDFDLEAIYRLYPRKQGKSNGMKKLKRIIQTELDYANMQKAIKRFCQHHAQIGTEPKYIPYFDTFLSTWEDWLEADTGQVKIVTHQEETTAQYLERKRREELEWEEEQSESDPEVIRQIIDRSLGKMI